EKIKKHSGAPEIILEPTPDILSGLGQRKTHQILVGFAAETENLEEYARAKMEAKRVDIMVANDVSDPEAGFEVPTNRAILLDSMGSHTRTPLMSKMSLAEVILDRVAVRLGRANNRESQ
ncbi:MAG: bifunctional 4'-phosphopantothenoylcysteine decarboxylase/phosphopantothenoylcysteine synthetase, partial [Acidimicrobiia bacterium]|nr:bifunctional 4'-phosphopantothenoylcysteine decarboxylase/phosphopantothenoylcysteine synthetase [Acidimicrobiia bacterium]